MLLEWCRAMTRNYEVVRRPLLQDGERVHTPRGRSVLTVASLPRSTWTSRTSPPAGAAAWPSAPSSTSSSQMPLTTQRWTPPSDGTTSPWPSPRQSKPQLRGSRRGRLQRARARVTGSHQSLHACDLGSKEGDVSDTGCSHPPVGVCPCPETATSVDVQVLSFPSTALPLWPAH